jgi:hypothetical protein
VSSRPTGPRSPITSFPAACRWPTRCWPRAARCGFTSAAYFSHAFRERFGLRAGDVRRGARP